MKISVITPVYNGEKFISRTKEPSHSRKGDFEQEHAACDSQSTGSMKNLREAYALVWLLTGVLMIVFSAFTSAFALLSFLIMVVLFLLFRITVVISEHNCKIITLCGKN